MRLQSIKAEALIPYVWQSDNLVGSCEFAFYFCWVLQLSYLNIVGSLEQSDQLVLPAGHKKIHRITFTRHYICIDRSSCLHSFVQFDLIITIFGKEYLKFLRIQSVIIFGKTSIGDEG